MTSGPKVVEAVARWYASCAFEMDIDRMTAEQRAMCETEARIFLDVITPLIVADAVKAEWEAVDMLNELADWIEQDCGADLPFDIPPAIRARGNTE